MFPLVSQYERQQIEKPRMQVQVRWHIRRDMPEILEIENASFEFAWTEEDFLCCLRQRNCIGMVAERDHEVMGFMVYELLKSRLRILNFAVRPDCRRHSVGQQMMQRLVDKLFQQRRDEIVLHVRETNLAAQLFFRGRGFRAVSVVRGHYDDTTEDAYYMQFRLDAVEQVLSPFFSHNNRITPYIPHNRISQYYEAA